MKLQNKVRAGCLFLYNLVGIRGKIMGIAMVPVVLLGLWLTLQVQQTMTFALEENLNREGISLGRYIAANSANYIFTGNIYALYELTQDTLANNPDLRYIFILNASGEVLTQSFGRGLPKGLKDLNSLGPGEKARVQLLDTEEGVIRDFALPIFEGRAGVVRLGLTERNLKQMVAVLIRRLWLTTLLMSLLVVAAAYGLAVLITRPIQQLAQVAKGVAKREFDRRVALDWAEDEIGQLGKAFNIMTSELKSSQEELEQKEQMRIYLLNKVITAQEEERKRIARELHDQTSQSLTSVIISLRILESAVEEENIKEKIEALRSLANSTLEEIHNLALQLRPPVLDDLGLVVALKYYVRACSEKWGVEIGFQTNGLGNIRLLPQVETSIYRIVQEALTNVAKHAGASNISVVLERQGDSLIAIVEDDGKGFPVETLSQIQKEKKRLGLFGMQERASLLGGTLTIESQPGSGTTVYVSLPLEELALKNG